MKKNPTLSRIYILVFALMLFATSVTIYHYQSKEVKLGWAETLANHPYKNREHLSDKELKNIAKADRPDLAMEQEVLMTMDPALGIVPTERKILANKKVHAILESRGPIPGITWQERGPNNVGGRSRAMMFDPNDPTNKKVWSAGVAGGLWYSNDITADPPVWNHVDGFWNNIIVTSIAYNPNNTQEFYVGTGEGWFNADAQRGGGIWKTSDGGVNWQHLSNTDPGAYDSGSHFQYVNKIVVKSNGYIFAATRGYYTNTGGVMRSIDGGASWTNVLTQYDGTYRDWGADIEIATNGDLYCSMGIGSPGKVYKSLDVSNGGSGTWTDISSNIGMGGAKRVELACSPSNANVIYAVAQGGSGESDVEWLKKSTDGGLNWSSMAIPLMADGSGNHYTRGQAFYDLILAVHPSNENLVIAGGIDLHRTTNGGGTWTPISHWYGGFSLPEVHADQHAIHFRPGASNEVLFGHDGGITFSTNAGNATVDPSFTNKNNGYNVTQFYACAAKNEINSHYFLAGAQDNGSQKFTMPQIGSTSEVSGGDGAFCHIDQLNPDIQMTAYTNNNLYRSLDGGNSFPSLISESSGHFINPSDYDSQRKILYLAAGNDQVKRIKGMDATISNTDLAISVGTAQVSALKVSPYNDVVFLGIENGRIYKYTNASGSSPVLSRIDNGSLPILTTGWVSSIDVGADDNHIMVTYSNYGVISIWETSDGGVNWYSKEGNLPDIPVRWALYNPENRNQVLIATEVGVWSTDNFGAGTNSNPDWGVSSTDLAYTRCTMLKYRAADKMVVVSTHGRGLFTSDVFVTSTIASFSVDQKVSCTGSLSVQFTDNSLNPGSSWAWDIDNDGLIDYTIQNPTHTYNSPGVYSVKLTINGGADEIVKENFIIVMSAEPTVNTGCSLSPNINNENNFGIGIFRFALSDIDNTTIHNDGYYKNYVCSKGTSLELSTLYNIAIQTGTFNNEGARVYIDYNDNGNFESGESVVSFPANKDGLRTSSFTTPSSGVDLDKGVRLRVVSKFGSIPSNACDIGTYGQVEDYTVYFKGNEPIWTGSISSDWAISGNWSNGLVPDISNDVIIPNVANDPIINELPTSPAICNDLTIESGAVLTINAGRALTVDGVLTNNAGVSGLILESDASGTASLLHNTSSVAASVERYINNADWDNWRDGWHFLSSPVLGQSISPSFTVSPATDYDFYCWYEAENLWVNYKNTTDPPTWATANEGSLNFLMGKGYLTAYKQAGTKQFSGPLNTQDISVNGLIISSGDNRSWHLLGNPYASALNWDGSGDWNMTNIAGVAKIWNEVNQSYSDLSSSPSSIIPATNGFMVQVSTGTGSLSIPGSKRVHSSQAFYKSDIPEIMLTVKNTQNGSAQESRVQFLSNASAGFDLKYDGEFIAGYGPQFYSKAGIEKLSTNSLPFETVSEGIPFVFIPNDGEQYRIEVEGLESIESTAYLIDLKNNEVHNLSESPSYSFIAEASDLQERFLLKFSAVGVEEVMDDDLFSAWYNNEQLFITTKTVDTQIEIFDQLGRPIYSTEIYAIGEHIIPLQLAKGMYIIRISAQNQQESLKIINL